MSTEAGEDLYVILIFLCNYQILNKKWLTIKILETKTKIYFVDMIISLIVV